ncbi:hypothetical protein BGW38_004005 [Lunasporangiospora selenospora]|uniref:DDT domain-containing protein n=1 Tax=Lunasporangiospora selenospora TaxID=979761 RepID=A0A9P6KHM5_9FUNG|nr:hypothetical protein BGW38_004005 [Lunasporangiospora selenospora]
MSSARPVRTSARQSALREQERHEQSESRFSRISSRSEQALAGEYSDATQGQGLSLATSASLDVTDMSPSVQPHPIEGYSDTVEIEPLQPFVDPDISHLPELAFAYGFLVKFKSLLKQSGPLPDFTIEDLETGMISVTPNACVAEIHANLLSNLQNRKKAVDTHAWQKVLSEILDTKQRTGEYPYENPLRLYKSYYQVEPRDRVEILKDLIDWVLQEGVAIRSGIEQDPEAFSVEPFGTDKEKWVYWYFGADLEMISSHLDGALRVYREKALRSKRHIWETVASDLDGIKALVDTFKDSTVRVEIELRDRLRTDIIEPIEERSLQNEKKQERMERKMQKIAELHEIAALKSTRTRSSNRTNQVRYTFDEEEDFEEEDVLYNIVMASRLGSIVSDLRNGLGAVRLRPDVRKVTLRYSGKSDNAGARYFARENLPRIQYNNPSILVEVQKLKEAGVVPELTVEFANSDVKKISCSRIQSSEICKQFLSVTTDAPASSA